MTPADLERASNARTPTEQHRSMTMEDDPDLQAEHAAIFGRTARAVIQAAMTFADGVQPTLTPLDSARIYLAAGTALAGAAVGRAGAVALLRDLADAIEAGDDTVRPN